jgi:hypothetical protein
MFSFPGLKPGTYDVEISSMRILAERLDPGRGEAVWRAPCSLLRRCGPITGRLRGLASGTRRGGSAEGNLLRHFLGQEDWDFFFGVFSGSHCAGHQFWHLMDASHPRHAASAPPALRSAIRDVYGAIDAALDALLSDLPPKVPVLLGVAIPARYEGQSALAWRSVPAARSAPSGV